MHPESIRPLLARPLRCGLIFAILLCLPPTSAQADGPPLVDFLFGLDEQCDPDWRLLQLAEFNALCKTYRLDPDDETNRNRFVKLRLLRELMTGVNSLDGETGGALDIPYFWNSVDPNPRHRITHRPTGKPLTKISPPPGFGRYKSYADLDRVPSVYLGGRAAEEVRFSHPGHIQRASAVHRPTLCLALEG